MHARMPTDTTSFNSGGDLVQHRDCAAWPHYHELCHGYRKSPLIKICDYLLLNCITDHKVS